MKGVNCCQFYVGDIQNTQRAYNEPSSNKPGDTYLKHPKVKTQLDANEFYIGFEYKKAL